MTTSHQPFHDAQAERGALIVNRLVPAPDHGRGFRRDPETGFVYYSSEWLSDEPWIAKTVSDLERERRLRNGR